MKVLDVNQFQVGYVFEPEDIKTFITREYASFLKRAGYVNLAKKPRLFVARDLLTCFRYCKTLSIEKEDK